jgi:hypothetical protein
VSGEHTTTIPLRVAAHALGVSRQRIMREVSRGEIRCVRGGQGASPALLDLESVAVWASCQVPTWVDPTAALWAARAALQRALRDTHTV